MLDAKQILDLLPHRYPFIMVDRVLEIEPGRRVVAIKNVSVNEPYFQGHFPGHPVMPGVLILEALAQAGAVALLAAPEHRGKLGLFAGLEGVRFRRQVVPGDQLRLEVEITRLRGSIGRGNGKAYVGGELVAEGELLFALTETTPAEAPGRALSQ